MESAARNTFMAGLKPRPSTPGPVSARSIVPPGLFNSLVFVSPSFLRASRHSASLRAGLTYNRAYSAEVLKMATKMGERQRRRQEASATRDDMLREKLRTLRQHSLA